MIDPAFTGEDIKRAMDLLDEAGWISTRDTTPPYVALKLTPEGQNQAQTLLKIVRELRCSSDRDLRVVLGLLSWYLNNDDMN